MLCQPVGGGQLGKHQFDMGSEAGFPEQDLTALMEVVSWGQKDEGQILESGQREGGAVRLTGPAFQHILAGQGTGQQRIRQWIGTGHSQQDLVLKSPVVMAVAPDDGWIAAEGQIQVFSFQKG